MPLWWCLFNCQHMTMNVQFFPYTIIFPLLMSPPPDPPLHLRPDLWISHHPHLSPSPTLPFLHFIFQNCNLRWPAVQGAPECVYADLHFITHSLTAGSLTRSVFQPSLPLAMFFVFFLNVLVTSHTTAACCSLSSCCPAVEGGLNC